MNFVSALSRLLKAVDLEAFLEHRKGLWMLSLAFEHKANVAIGGGHMWVVVAKDLTLDFQVTVVVLQCLWKVSH